MQLSSARQINPSDFQMLHIIHLFIIRDLLKVPSFIPRIALREIQAGFSELF